MTKVAAGITISQDGFVAGLNDGPEQGLGEGGERLHYWVFGGPWGPDDSLEGREATGVDKQFLDEGLRQVGAVIAGRNTFDFAFEAWGRQNPFPVPLFILTHRAQDAPEGFMFVESLDQALSRAREAAGDKTVFFMGGADTIRQALREGHVEELAISIAPVVLGAGKRYFGPVDGQHLLEDPEVVIQGHRVLHVRYRVRR